MEITQELISIRLSRLYLCNPSPCYPLTEPRIYCNNCTFRLSSSAAHTDRSVAFTHARAHTHTVSAPSVFILCSLVVSVTAINPNTGKF